MPSNSQSSRIDRLVAAYADHPAECVPSRVQWEALATLDEDRPVALVNYFRFRQQAAYPDGRRDTISGQEAFSRYTAVSGDALTRAGGRFLMFGKPAGPLIGSDRPWDLVAIGSYSSPQGIFTIFEDPEYHACMMHRTAAVEDQLVTLCVL
jgi:uncharacterized protein (DUF1330 family)